MIDGFVISRSQALHSLAASPRLFTHSPLLLCTPYFNVARKYTHGYPISIDNAPRKYPIQKFILSSLFKIRVSLPSGRVCQQATVDSGVRESPYIIRLARYQTRPPAIGHPITAVPEWITVCVFLRHYDVPCLPFFCEATSTLLQVL